MKETAKTAAPIRKVKPEFSPARKFRLSRLGRISRLRLAISKVKRPHVSHLENDGSAVEPHFRLM